MKADIEELVGNHVSVYIVKTENTDENGLSVWEAMLYNSSSQRIDNILINTKGYGQIGEREVSTATMRYFKENLDPMGSFCIEPITAEVLKINNEFWITYSLDSKLYESKLVFSSEGKDIESIDELGKEGYRVG
jgi:hypothetical protein